MVVKIHYKKIVAGTTILSQFLQNQANEVANVNEEEKELLNFLR